MLPDTTKTRPIPYHLQDDVKSEVDRLLKSVTCKNWKQSEIYCFVSPVVITVENDKSVKNALDPRKLNDSCINKRPHMPNMEELLKQLSSELSKNDLDATWVSVIDLDYYYGQMQFCYHGDFTD